MIEEVIDKHSGAILFKKSKETQNLEYALKKIAELEKRIEELERKDKEEDS